MLYQLHALFCFNLSRFLMCLVLCSAVGAAELSARDACLAKLDRLATIQQAAAEVADARIDQESWKLNQLKSLRERGHATWLEVARQQLTTDVLVRQRAAMTEFSNFAGLLKRIGRETAASQPLETSSRDTTTVIKLSMPGSLRLVGWIEDNHAFSELRASLPDPDPRAQRQNGDDRQLTRGKEQLQRAIQRCEVYAGLESISPAQLQQAELCCAIAKAKVRFLQLALDQHIEDIHDTTFVVHEAIPSEVLRTSFDRGATPITPRANLELGLAALRVAEAEASAEGEIQAARIALERSRRRCESLETLHTRGHASQQELGQARDQLAGSTRHVAELLANQTRLIQSCRLLRQSLHDPKRAEPADGSPPQVEAEPGTTSPSAEGQEWPSSMAARWQFLTHALELRRDYLTAEAEGDVWLQKLETLQQYHANLQQSIENTPDSGYSTGIQRQLDDQVLELAYYQARHRATQERLTILAAEERRFQEQCYEHQRVASRSAKFQSTSVPLGLRSKPVSLTKPRALWSDSLSYLESEFFADPARLRITGVRDRELWMTYPTQVDHPLGAWTWTRFRPSPPLGSRRFQREGRDDGRLDRAQDACFSAGILESPGGWRSRPLTTGNVYPFGILRSDLRRRLTLGQTPWYLPGSAANLRPRP